MLLAWGLGLVSLAVVCVIGLILLLAIYRSRVPESRDENGHYPVRRAGTGLAWIYVGLGVSVPILAVCTVWTLAVLGRVAAPPSPPALTIQVTAHRWWWEIRYIDGNPARIFTTANEIHLPAGVPVRVLLSSSDVIHSFWVPKLAGKMDVVPGLTNVTWLEADMPGEYRGQCGEFCGVQHAKMALSVVAETPRDFERWWDRQLNMPAGAGEATTGIGGQVFVARCGACHTMRGTSAGGIAGPDLSHFGGRATIAAGTLPNDTSHLTAWIVDPHAFKPGTLMPHVPLSPSERGAVVAFLQSAN
jgi:cytochrome c oxidase subunit 2